MTTELLLQRKNPRSITIDEIAGRASASKGTIYKQWGSKSALFVESFFDSVRNELIFDETLPALEALRKQYHSLVSMLAGAHGEVLRALIGESQFDTEIHSALLKGYFLPRRSAAIGCVADAIDAKELRNDLSPDIAVDALYGALFYALMVRYRTLDDRWANDVIDAVLQGLKRSPGRSR
ncbi:MAG TPA: TetR/AcrR family transcriptional regulator [Xanthobacteraceae bacterium]|nr:TetR/AcrR family transcriptional regulator [Xanthobacteraceae bacterium]